MYVSFSSDKTRLENFQGIETTSILTVMVFETVFQDAYGVGHG